MSEHVGPTAETGTIPGPAAAAGKPARLSRLFKRGPTDPLGPNYRKLWVAHTISNLGDGVRWTALPLMAVEISRDPAVIAAIDLAGSLPWFLFALLAGAFVDRVDRRRAMGVSNIIRAVLVGALAIAVITDSTTMVMLYVVAFLLGCAETVFDNASQAILPALVRKDQLEKANGRMYAAEFISNQFAGPPLGAFLFVWIAASPFLLDSASFLIAALLILGFKGSFRTERVGEKRNMRAEIAEGLRWLWSHRVLRTLAICLGIWNAMSTAVFSIFVLFALEVLGVSQIGYGFLLATFTIGSVIGSLIASRIAKILGPGTALILQMAIGCIGFLGIGTTSSPIVVGAMFALEGVIVVVWNVITVSMRQSIIPDHLLGRVNSVYRLLGWGMMPFGAAIGGFLARGFGLRAPYLVSAAVLGVLTVVAAPFINNRAIAAAKADAE
jgi:MFS family permease